MHDLSPPPAASPMTAAEAGAPVDRTKFVHRRDIPGGPPGLNALLLDAAVLAGVSEVAEVRIADASGRQVPYVLEHRAAPLSIELGPPIRDCRLSSQNTSAYRIDLPFAGLPASRLVVTTPARVFERSVVAAIPAGERDSRDTAEAGAVLTTAAWRHSETDMPAPSLALELPATTGSAIELRMEEGDNAPLPLGPARLLLPAYRLRFFRPSGARLTLLYGNDGIGPPRYDIALLAARVLGSPANEISLSARPAPSAAGGPTRESRVFWLALVAAALLLIAVILRLVSKAAS